MIPAIPPGPTTTDMTKHKYLNAYGVRIRINLQTWNKINRLSAQVDKAEQKYKGTREPILRRQRYKAFYKVYLAWSHLVCPGRTFTGPNFT